MGFVESFRIALGMLALHKMRAFLTMLGVIIGVMSVTLIVMILNGFQNYMKTSFEQMGARTIFIAYDGFGRSSERAADIEGLTEEDVTYIKDRVASLGKVTANYEIGEKEAVYKDKVFPKARVSGVDQFAPEFNNLQVVAGRHINADDLVQRANVCVIGEEVSNALFGGNEVGKYIDFDGITLEVVGVMETITIMGQSNGPEVWVPLSTVQDKWVGGSQISFITAEPVEGYPVSKAMDDVWAALMRKSGNKRIYRVDSQESMLGVLSGIIGGAGFVLAGIAALSLLVGGIGIMNIMLVSVTERTKEIGLRKAVGARRSAVLTQFLVESAVLSLVGGLIGMAMAWLLGQGISLLTIQAKIPSEGGIKMIFPLSAAIGAMAFSAGIGVVFGLYPAVRASALSPIEALRTE